MKSLPPTFSAGYCGEVLGPRCCWIRGGEDSVPPLALFSGFLRTFVLEMPSTPPQMCHSCDSRSETVDPPPLASEFTDSFLCEKWIPVTFTFVHFLFPRNKM